MKDIDISIIIPCYNLEEYIERCIGTILRQNYNKEKYELIFVIDQCTDCTERIIREQLEQFQNLQLVYSSHRSPGLSRNIGLEIARGEYVWFIDGDDYLVDNGAFKKLIETAQGYNVNSVFMKKFETDGLANDDFAAWRYFYKRELIKNEKFGNERINEDWAFTQKIKKREDYREVEIEEVFYHYTFPRKGSVLDNYFAGLHKIFKGSKK